MTQAFKAVIHGRVQGVCFRAGTREYAVSLNLRGWVRNRGDGTVEVYASGSETALNRLRQWLRHGPSMASVSEVVFEDADYEPHADFEIR